MAEEIAQVLLDPQRNQCRRIDAEGESVCLEISGEISAKPKDERVRSRWRWRGAASV
jgi:hypothetical protein